MSHELLRQRPAHSLEQNRVVRVLENAPMSLLLDVLEVLAGRTLGRIVLAHVTQTPGEFGESLTIGAVAHPRHRQMLRAGKAWTRDEREDRLGVEVHRAGGKRGTRVAGSGNQRRRLLPNKRVKLSELLPTSRVESEHRPDRVRRHRARVVHRAATVEATDRTSRREVRTARTLRPSHPDSEYRPDRARSSPRETHRATRPATRD